MGDEESDYLFKIVVVGDSSVGKSQLILRYTTNQFAENTKATIGVSFGHKTVQKGDELIQAQIWDTAGQERFRSITPGFYRGTQGALLVYSITDRKSFDNCESWLNEIKKQSDCLIMLVGNKSDLTDQRAVQTNEARDFAAKHELLFIETSAKEATNVDKAFEQVVSEIYDQAKSGMAKDSESGLDEPSAPAPSTAGSKTIKLENEPTDSDGNPVEPPVARRCC